MRIRLATALVSLVIALVPGGLCAQSLPPAEVYIGYPHLTGGNASQLFGVHGAVTARSRSGFGVGGEVAIHFGEVFADKSLWTFLAGPTFSTKGRFRGIVQAKFGTAISGCGEFRNGCRTTASFASALGGGVEFSPRGGVSYRAQLDRLFTRLGDNRQFTRLSFGAVFPLSSNTVR